MADTQFSVSWDAYQKSICNGLSGLQQRGEFVDMTIAADGHHVKVHQMVMSLISPYIKELITSAQCPHPVVFLNQVSYQSLESILEYAYTGEVVVSKEKLTEFLQACKALHIKGLEDLSRKASEPEPVQYKLTPAFFQNRSSNATQDETSFNDTAQDFDDSQMDDDHNMDSFDNNDDNEGETTTVQTPTRKSSLGLHSSAKDCNILQYSVSAMGSLQLVLNRYIYHMRHSRKDRQTWWQCANHEGIGPDRCRATLITRGSMVTRTY